MTVDRAFETALYAETDTALDTGASLLAADPSADAELAQRGEEFIATAWRRGWQPADVVRIVRRELDETHVRLVSRLILSAEARHKQPRGRRWAAQLEDLDSSDVQTERTDRFSYATAVLELYRLLLRLPPLEPLDDSTAKPSHKPPGERQAPESRILPVSAPYSPRRRRPATRRRRRRSPPRLRS